MKTIILALLLFPILAFTQSPVEFTKDTSLTKFELFPKNEYNRIEYSSGDYLKKAGRNFIAGNLLMFGGVGISIIASMSSINGNLQEHEQFYVLSAVLGVSGLILNFTAYNNLISAGKASNKEHKKKTAFLQLKPTNNGISLVYHFNKAK